MKKIFLFLLVIASIYSEAQIPGFTSLGQNVTFKRATASQLFSLPQDTFAIPATLQTVRWIANKGDSIYVWSVWQHKWVLNTGGGGGGGISTTLASGNFIVGNVSNVATSVTPTGDVTFDNTGVFSIGVGKITNAMVNGSAAIAYSKLNLASSIVNADISNSAAIAISKLAASTISGVSLGGTLGALTAGNGLSLNSGTTFDGSAAKTAQVDTAVISTKANVTDKLQTKQNLLKLGADFTANGDSLFLKGDYVNIKDFGAIDDNSTNNSTAIAAAIATGKPVFIPPGGIFKYATGVTLNTGQIMFGMGNRSQLKYTGTVRAITLNDTSKVINFHLIGNGKASGNANETGVLAFQHINWVIQDMLIEGFGGDSLANGGGGIDISAIAPANSEGANVINCRVLNCKTGINIPSRGEYASITGCTVANSTVGISIGAGNFNVTGCIFENNTVNVKIYLGTNNGHGIFTSCLINHGATYALQIENISPTLGIAFTNCMIYFGALYFKVANNIRFVNCNFSGLDSVHMDSTYDITRSACQWGKTGLGNVVPINKFRGGVDFEVLGETRFDGTSPNYWIKQQNGTDTVLFTGLTGIGIVPTADFHIKAGTAAANTAPLKLTSGTNLTTPEAGAMEYDGAQLYETIDASSGRGAIPVNQYFHLTANGSAITSIANFFGTTSNISLVSGASYVIEAYLWYVTTGTGAVTFTFTNSAAPTSQNIVWEMSPITGVVAPPGTATMLAGQTLNDATAAKTVVTGSLSAGTHYAHVKIFLINATGTSLKIQATSGGTNLTPQIGSWWTCQRVSTGNVGTFAN